MKKLIFTILSFFIIGQSFGQGISLTAELDSSNRLIGEQSRLSINIKAPLHAEVFLPVYADTITKEIEILSLIQLDTLINSEFLEIKHQYLITSFDSGFHAIPPFMAVVIHDQDTQVVQSQALLLSVNNVEVDLNADIKDISEPLRAPITFKEIMIYVLGFLLLIIPIILLIYIIRKLIKKEPIFEFRKKEVIPPYITAMQQLKKLEASKLWQHNKVKDFYIQLSDILRTYIENQFQIPATDRITSEIIQLLDKKDFDQDQTTLLNELLVRADFAKFAKGIPLPDENQLSMKHAISFVETSLPKDEDELKKEEVSS